MPSGKNRSTHGQKFHIGLAVVHSIPFVERVCRGIVDYAKSCGGWCFSIMPEMLMPSIDWLKQMRLDGAVAFIVNKRDVKIARDLRFPVVNMASHLNTAPIPTVAVDHKKIGEQAAEFLIKKGFTRLAYYGTRNLWYSQLRQAGVLAAARRASAECQSHVLDFSKGAEAQSRDQHYHLLRWLKTLKPPVGLVASTDLRAAMILDACAEVGLRVPDDMAIVGVDDDPVVCETRAIPITSVARNDWKVGWEAAVLLERLMRGEARPSNPCFVPPGEIVQRKSTDTHAVDDPLLSALMAELRENMSKPLGVEWLIAQTGHSRRWLEMRFRKLLGKSPHTVITQMRVAKARELLVAEKHMPLTDIAARCGFTDLKRFREVFQKHTGMIPKKFRQKNLPAGVE